MRRCALATGVAVVLVAASTIAAELTGKWKADFETADGQKIQNVFTFAVDGEQLTGTVYSSLAGSEAKIEEGQIKGDEISFSIIRNFGGSDVRLRYTGKVAGDEIRIVVTAAEGGDGFKLEMIARREK